jgi:hypothetical protein
MRHQFLAARRSGSKEDQYFIGVLVGTKAVGFLQLYVVASGSISFAGRFETAG